MLPYFHGAKAEARIPFVEKTNGGLIGGLRVSQAGDDLPQVAMRLRSPDGSLSASIREQSYAFRPSEPVTLAPGATVAFVFVFVLEVSFLVEGQPDFPWPAGDAGILESMDFDGLVALARARFAEAIAIENAPPVPRLALVLKAWRARHALLRNGLSRRDGEFGTNSPACAPPTTRIFPASFLGYPFQFGGHFGFSSPLRTRGDPDRLCPNGRA